MSPSRLLLPLGLALLATGCITGERPNFDDDQPIPTGTGDEAVDAVLDRLDEVPVRRFTAEYALTTKFGDIESVAVVVQAADGRRSITINDIRFVVGDGTDATCDLVTEECEASLNDARVSDIGVTHNFYSSSFATRLRVDANRRVGDTRGYTLDVAGRPATCVDVPLSGVTKTYCALDSGPLARYSGNDLSIELTKMSDAPDESQFETG